MLIQSLLSPEETARMLGISAGTLSVWRCTGRYSLPYIKIGGCVKYKQEDLNNFIERQTRFGHGHAKNIT